MRFLYPVYTILDKGSRPTIQTESHHLRVIRNSIFVGGISYIRSLIEHSTCTTQHTTSIPRDDLQFVIIYTQRKKSDGEL